MDVRPARERGRLPTPMPVSPLPPALDFLLKRSSERRPVSPTNQSPHQQPAVAILLKVRHIEAASSGLPGYQQPQSLPPRCQRRGSAGRVRPGAAAFPAAIAGSLTGCCRAGARRMWTSVLQKWGRRQRCSQSDCPVFRAAGKCFFIRQQLPPSLLRQPGK